MLSDVGMPLECRMLWHHGCIMRGFSPTVVRQFVLDAVADVSYVGTGFGDLFTRLSVRSSVQ
jgi:hypothetical protein